MRPTSGARIAALGAIVLAAVVIGACREPTEIVVAVTTDLPCSRLDSTQIAVGRTGEVDGKPPATVSTQCIDGKIGTLVVVPSGSDDEEVALRVVTGVGKSAEQCANGGFTGGCIVARRALRFTPHATLRVPVAMRASCIDIPCSGSAFETCVHGACVSGKVESSACAGDGCDEGKLAPGTSPATDGGPGGDAASTEGGAEGGTGDAGSSDAPIVEAGPDAGVSTGGGVWTAIPTAPVEARSHAYAVWTGTNVLVFGGETATSFTQDGAVYDPATNKWIAVMKPYAYPNAHQSGRAVWVDTVKRVVFWGGTDGSSGFANGKLYDPATDNWIAMKAPPVGFVGRSGQTAVWTGTEVIFWGGDSQSPTGYLNDGAAYNPATDTWRLLPQAPLSVRTEAAATWDGKSMHVFGGVCDGSFCTDGATYTPDAQNGTWSAAFDPGLDGRPDSAAFVLPRGGQSALSIFFGGGNYWNDLATSDGFFLDPDASSKLTVFYSPALTILPVRDRIDNFVWFGRGRVWTFGGLGYDKLAKSWSVRGEGASLDIATGQWTAMPAPPTAGPTSVRTDGMTVWLGDRAFLFGGTTPAPGDAGGDKWLGDGWLFVPN